MTTRLPANRSAPIRGRARGSTSPAGNEIVWSWPGTLNGSTVPSPRWRAPFALTITSVTVTAGAAGGGDSDFHLYINNVLNSTYTLISGDTVDYYAATIAVAAGAILHFQQDGSVFSVGVTNAGIIVRYTSTSAV